MLDTENVSITYTIALRCREQVGMEALRDWRKQEVQMLLNERRTYLGMTDV